MHGIFEMGFGAFVLLSSAAYAIPEPIARRNNVISVQIDENAKHETLAKEIIMSPEDIHTAEEFGVIMMFDEVVTEGNYIWPSGYGNCDWSSNFYIFNQTEQNLFPRNHASSPPNLLFVQDSSHSGGAEANFKVHANSPAQAFDFHGISILPYAATIKSPIMFSIRGYPANGGNPIVKWYRWTMDAQLQYPWDAHVEGVNSVNKVEIFVVPGSDILSKERLPFTLDNIKITWRNTLTVAVEEASDVVIIENHQGTHRGL